MNPYLLYNDGGEIPTISLTDEEIEAGRKGNDKSRIKDYVEPEKRKLNALGEVDIPNMPNLGRVQGQQEKLNYLIAQDKESGNTNTPEFLETDDIIGPKTLAVMNHYEKKGAYKRPYLFSDDNLALYKKQAEERMVKKQIVDSVKIQESTPSTNPIDIMNIIGPQGKSYSIDYPMNLMRNAYASNQEYAKMVDEKSNQEYSKLADERIKLYQDKKAKEKMIYDKSNQEYANLADERFKFLKSNQEYSKMVNDKSNKEYSKLADERFKFFKSNDEYAKLSDKRQKLEKEKTKKSNTFDVYAPLRNMGVPLAKAPETKKEINKNEVTKASAFTLPSFNYSSPNIEEKKQTVNKQQDQKPKQNFSEKYYNTNEYIVTEKNKPYKDLSDNDKYNSNLFLAQEILNKTSKRFYQKDKKYIYQTDLYEGYLDAIADAPLIPRDNPKEYNQRLNEYNERYTKLDSGINKKLYQNLFNKVFKGKEKILKSDFEKYRISVNRAKLK